MNPGDKENASQDKQWPYCEFLQSECLAHAAAQRLGFEPFVALLRFIATAETGARLTLQRNRGDFTVQVTNAIEKAREKSLDLEELKQLTEVLTGRKVTAKE